MLECPLSANRRGAPLPRRKHVRKINEDSAITARMLGVIIERKLRALTRASTHSHRNRALPAVPLLHSDRSCSFAIPPSAAELGEIHRTEP